ncbi:MAG: glycosyltransferase [Ktedonobacteraceae bacterium]
MSESRCRVSVVVPTYKRPEMLRRCIAALMAQDFEPTDYEVIVADDAANDETRQEVEELASRMHRDGRMLRYVPVQGAHGPAAARNAGWRVATGEIIAFTDDDCVPSAGWLSAGVAAFHEGVIGVAGRLIVPLSSEHCPTDYERNAAQLVTAQFVTANCFYRRFCLAAVAGFDERFTAAWREDSDLLFTLLETAEYYPLVEGTGKDAFVYVPAAAVVHPLRSARWGVSLSQQRKSMFNALLYKKHAKLYREQIQATPPWHYYAIVSALVVILGGIGTRKYRLMLGACSLWLWLTGRFCWRRLQATSHQPRHVAEMVVTSILIPPLALFWRIWGAIKFRVFFL